MENYKHILSLVTFACFNLFTAYASDAEIRIIESKDPETFKLIYIAPSEKNLNIKLVNSNGKIVLRNKVPNSKGFILPLSFKGLPSDRYTIEVSSDDVKLQEEIHYVNIIDRLKGLVSVEFDTSNKKCIVTSNSEYSGDWGIVVYNEQQDQLISDAISNSSFDSRIYDLNGAPGSELEVVVMFKGEVVSEWRFDEF